MNDLAVIADIMGHEVLGILDHQYYGQVDEISNIPVIGSEQWLSDPLHTAGHLWQKTCVFFVATLSTGEQINDPGSDRERLRHQRIELIRSLGLSTVNLIDPDSYVMKASQSRWSRIQLGQGIFIAPTADIPSVIKIGDFCTIEHSCLIGHHQIFGTNVTVLPTAQLCDCDIGSNSVIGFGAWTQRNSRKPRYQIGAWSTIWSHACINMNVPDNHILTHTGRILKKQRSLAWLQQVDQ